MALPIPLRLALQSAVLVSVAFASGHPLHAQHVIHEWSSGTEYFGNYIVLLEDIDQDGVADLAISDIESASAPPRAGRTHFISGRSGRTLFQLEGSKPDEGLHVYVAVSDLDADGVADFMTRSSAGPSGGGYMYTFWSARTMRPLLSFATPWWFSVSPLGDLDRDGLAELAIGDYRYSPTPWRYSGRVDIVSLRTGQIVASHLGERDWHGMGGAHPIGDVDADGTPDYVIQPAGYYPYSSPDQPRFHSGATHQQLFRTTLGAFVVPGGDLNADGIEDVLAGGLRNVVLPTHFRIYGYGGPDGRSLFVIERTPPARIGDWVVNVGDVDGDGHTDLFSSGEATTSYIFSGRDQSLLITVTGLQAGHGYGTGDLDGDDFPDFVVSWFPDTTRKVNRVRAYSGAPVGVATLGIGCATRAGVIPRIGASFTPEVGKPFAINLSRVEPLTSAQLVLGSSATTWNGTPLPLDLTAFGMPGCTLRTSIDAQFVRQAQGISHKGWSRFETTIPNDPRLRGATFYAQWLVFGQDAVGPYGVTTRALAVTIQ